MPDMMEWPLSWRGVTAAEFQLMPRSQRSQSPWTMRQNVYGPHVQYWRAKLVYPQKKDATLAAMEAVIESLGGSAGLLRIGHPFRKRPMFNDDVEAAGAAPEPFSDDTFFEDGSGWASGFLPGTISVYEAAVARATSVVVQGLPVSTSRPLRRGDLVEFRANGIADTTARLHRVTRDAHSNAAGRTRIEIQPPLRKGLAAGDMVVLDNPMSVFRLMDDDAGGAVRSAGWHGNLELNLVEALDLI